LRTRLAYLVVIILVAIILLAIAARSAPGALRPSGKGRRARDWARGCAHALRCRLLAPPAPSLAVSLAHAAVLIVLRLLMGPIFAGSLARLLAEAPIARTLLHDA
jgi:hypothetical protein